MPKFLIIDGSSMLSTSYYGNLPKSILFAKTDEEKERHYPEILHTSDGKYTNAMFTMLRTLLAVYKKVKPEYVAFTFDMTRDTFRRTQLGADFYKANRKETAQPLKEQFIQMEELLKAIGCPVFMSQDYEADDYAASLVEKFQGPDLQTYVLTKDHDYFQLVSEYTRMWRVVTKDKLENLKDAYGLFGKEAYEELPSNVFEYTPEIVCSEEGVYPEQIPVLLAITGDPGDGIPGCKGVSSAAAPLVEEYKTLDAIYEAIEDCEDVAKKEKELNTFWKENLGIGRSPLKALKTKALIKKAFDKAFEKYDVIVAPAAPTTAPELGKSLSDPMKMYLSDIYTISVNLAGLPGISIPVGKDSKGLPVGMQLIGDCFQEKKLFQAAYTYECLTEKKWVSMYDKTEAAGKGEA